MADAKPVDTTLMQVVDYEENFYREAAPFLRSCGIAARGFDYNVVAIMGPQSSGKSTLMNLLFGTKFVTMEADSGRYQVTQGVWMGCDSEAKIVVMDNEGCDSRERGEDGATFERKSALFVLALSEVLIVNVWTQDVGRFNAANLQLLKTVMELDMQLFYGASSNGRDGGKDRMHKTRLLFVLRDHYAVEVGGTSVEQLSRILTDDVNNIWKSIAKPEAAKGTPVTDFFDIDFYALPHKILAPEAFVAAGAKLKQKFRNGELFRKEYSRGVAADGFAAYAESVWETVRANKELDIPSQKEMLAHVRCEQIAHESAAVAEKTLLPMRASLLPIDGGKPSAIPGLYAAMLTAANEAIDGYKSSACRYQSSVAEMKGIDLNSKLGADCKALYDAQTTVVADGALSTFRRSITDAQRRAKPWKEWGAVSQKALITALETFDGSCETGTLPADAMPPAVNPHPLSFTRSAFTTARRRLDESLRQELDRATKEVTIAARAGCLKVFQDSFKPPLSTVLESADEDVWARASEVSSAAWEKTARHAKSVYGPEGLDFAGDVLESSVEDDLKPDCYERAIKTCKDLIGSPANFLLRMQKRFDDNFRFDDRGVPRHFGPDEDIEALFVAAREKGESLAGLLSEVKLSGVMSRMRSTARDVDTEITNPVIFEEHSQVDLREKLRRQAGAVFVEAKRAQEASKITTKIPMWLIGLLVILGWNEIMMVLRSPLLLILTIVVVPVLYVSYTLDAPTMLGPALQTMAMPYVRQARDLIDQYVPTDDRARPATTAAAAPATD
jgi:protein SEY1